MKAYTYHAEDNQPIILLAEVGRVEPDPSGMHPMRMTALDAAAEWANEHGVPVTFTYDGSRYTVTAEPEPEG